MKRIFLVVALISAGQSARCQEPLPFTGRSIYAEALGGAWRGSLNVEEFLFNKRRWTGFARAGIEYVPPSNARPERLESYQGGLSLSKWMGRHHADIGIAILYRRGSESHVYDRDYVSEVFFMPSIGYRYQPPGGGLIIRATVPFLHSIKDYYITRYEIPYPAWRTHAAVSVGYFFARKKVKGSNSAKPGNASP